MNRHKQSINEIGCVKWFVLNFVETVNQFQEVIAFLSWTLAFEEPFSLDHVYFYLDSGVHLFFREEFPPEIANYTALLIFQTFSEFFFVYCRSVC